MLKSPDLKACYHLGLLEKEFALLVSERSTKVVKGALLCDILANLGDAPTADDLVDRLAPRFQPAEVYYGLLTLEQQGVLEERDGTPTLEAVFWGLLDLKAASVRTRLAASQVGLTSTGAEVGPLAEALQAQGIGQIRQVDLTETHLDDVAVTVVVCADYLEAELERFNQAALQRGHRWLLFKPMGIQPCVGPLFVPGRTACWACLAERQWHNREVEAFLARRHGSLTFPIAPQGTIPGARALAEHFLATIVARLLAEENRVPLEGQVFSLNLRDLKIDSHQLIRLPYCPACGEGNQQESWPQPPELLSKKKSYRLDGGHRIVSPEETYEAYCKHISSITGLMSPLIGLPAQPLQAPRFSLTSNLQVYFALHRATAEKAVSDKVESILMPKSCSGKGHTQIQAKTSALCETLERISALFRGSEPRLRASYDQVRDRAYHPNELLLYSERQYRERDIWNLLEAKSHFVPKPFEESREIDWSPAWSLTHQDWKLVPTPYLYFGYLQEGQTDYCLGDSNGMAAGNCLEEAVLQGLLEIVERDAVAIWWYNRLERPGLDLAAIKDPMVQQFLDAYAALGRRVWVLDLTVDLGIPVCAAVAALGAETPEQPVMGFGAHLDPKMALLRALSEMNQSLHNTYYFHRFYPSKKLEWVRKFTQEAQLADHPYLLPAQELHPVSLERWPDQSADDLLEDIHLIVEKFRQEDLEVLLHDLTRPEIGLPTVKMAVPGTCHIWARFAPGRLYDVPVKMGWLAKPKSEDELNIPYIS
jgi:ribosomal protein S12 methylthiotransferase accessory factor